MTKLSMVLLSVACVTAWAGGADSYSKCASCHGAKGEKAAMGASKVINTMSKEEITKALKGYKDGSYGGAKKGIMKGQVAPLSDAQIGELAAYIPTLK